MTYSETIAYLYAAAPLFQQVGGAAYKEGLETTLQLDSHFNHPHRRYRTIHVAGTNGKGSCAHTLAAMLQHKGLKVGLYTSPHLIDFRERIRINGQMIPEEYVVRFVETERSFFEPLHPSFFEITTALAFKYFADEAVDVAVIEVGLGGRLDCTNIITPVLSVITNISFDHTQFLGSTLADIAAEKAGIMKCGVPVVVGEARPETRPVFEQCAKQAGAPLYFAEDEAEVVNASLGSDNLLHYVTRHWGTFAGELIGDCQRRNTNTLLCAAQLLAPPFGLAVDDVHDAFRHVCETTSLMGRWQVLQQHPTVVCDTGHNLGGWEYISIQLAREAATHARLHVVFGMASDKDLDGVLSLLPHEASYYWTQASVRRATPVQQLAERAASHDLYGLCFDSVSAAYQAALAEAGPDDLIYIGGSCFVVADLLSALQG
ncbi:MAG: bifunctional folylpolyglutamate synthase/dihydrofolate synthase [Alloprevotella sp.]